MVATMAEDPLEPRPRDEPVYRIGAVAQLTGLPANTIRTWERRHQAVQPHRSPGGGRLYADEDVERLQLLKALVSRGDAISSVAGLSTSVLQDRIRRIPVSTRVRKPPSLRVGLLHGSLSSAFELHAPEFGAWDVGIDEHELAPFLKAASAASSIDVMIVELSLLGPEPEANLERCIEATGADVVVVLYHFASSTLLEDLADAGARLVRAPVQLAALKRLVLEQVESGAPARRGASWDEPPEPRPPAYDERQLFRLRSITSTVDCECPTHLAQLIEQLVAFEQYSANCEHRSPQDEVLHRTLRRGTGQARMQMEDLLERVLEAEEIIL